MRINEKKYIILGSLCALLLTLAVGYAAFQTNLKIKGTSNISSKWDVRITNVTETNKNGEAETVGTPTWTELTANIEANLYDKEDYIEYDVTVENNGSLDAALENIKDELVNNNEAIKISFSGYTKGEKLYKNTSQKITVRIEYNPEFTGTPEEGSTEINLDLNYVQAEGGTITPTDKYLVTYDCVTNGGQDCSKFNEYLNGGETINLNYVSQKEGFEFIGWNTNKDAKDGLKEYIMPENDITLYAIFKDTTPPECEIKVTEATLDSVTVHTNCNDASGIKEYKYTQDQNEETTDKDIYNLNNYNLSKLTLEVTDKANNKGTFKISEENLNKGYKLIYDALNSEYINIEKEKQSYETEFLDKTYPIGSIYIATNNENPNETIGGTWEKYGKGKTLVGIDEEDINFNEVNKTGGSKTSTLAVTNLPSHSHNIPTLSGTAKESGNHAHNFVYKTSSNSTPITISYLGGNISSVNLTGWNWVQTTEIYTKQFIAKTTGNHTHSITTAESITGNIGNATPLSFTNLQPYTTVHIYKRVS